MELAERLVSIHPWSEKVKLARSGGEANAIAIRIARAILINIMWLFVGIMVGMIGIYHLI